MISGRELVDRWDDRSRNMYNSPVGNATARRYARVWSVVFGLGVLPKRWVTLEVPGRKSGRLTRFPLGMTDLDGTWYLASMLGECNWLKNVRAVGGHVVLRRRRPRWVRLVQVPVEQRAPIIKRYLEQVPGGRPHIPVDRREPVKAFVPIAADYPVFRVEAENRSGVPAIGGTRRPVRVTGR